jgi:hypothetical protein
VFNDIVALRRPKHPFASYQFPENTILAAHVTVTTVL